MWLEVVDAPSLDALEPRLGVALGSLVCWLVTLHTAGVGTDGHCGPFQPRPFYESVISRKKHEAVSVVSRHRHCNANLSLEGAPFYKGLLAYA